MSHENRSLVQEIVYGVCRWYGELDAVAGTLLRSPIRNKDRVVHFVLLVGLYQLRHLHTAEHAAVAETVEACTQLNKSWAKNLINGCLRNYQRQPVNLAENAAALSHPQWLREQISVAWPQYADKIFTANNARPPMCLRVNSRHQSRQHYQALLGEAGITASNDPFCADGLILETPMPVAGLPEFQQGAVSVQDTAAQLACDLLAASPGMHVLDACAAPGGKAAHLLERADNNLVLDALDNSAERANKLRDTLQRLQLSARVTVADASGPAEWNPPTQGYDRIMIDAPCSGIGVIRRHPDIRHHRRPDDVHELVALQKRILENLWPLLKPGGRLLYLTCSILPAENNAQMLAFVTAHSDAILIPITQLEGLQLSHGLQTLPGLHSMDGFFYSLVEKRKQI